MKKLLIYLKKYQKELVLGPLFKLVEAIFELIVPLIMAAIIDQGIKGHDLPLILHYGLLLVLLAVVGLASSLICQYFAALASQGFGTDLRNAMFAHIQSLSYFEVDQIGTPSLITRCNNDINQLQLAVAMMIRLALRAPFLVLGSCIMAMRIDWQLALVFLIAAPLIAIVLYLIMSRSIPYYRSIQSKLDRLSLLTRENLDGVRVIRATSNQEHEQQRFTLAVEELFDTSIKAGKIQSNLNPLTYLIVNFSILAIIYYGSHRVYGGSLTQGEIIAFVSYMTQMLLALNVVANLVVIFTKAGASANRVSEVLSLSSSIQFNDQQPLAKDSEAAVTMKHVSFHYPNSEENILEDTSFTLKPGEVLGIIGGTGAGKSTLIHLINRFYDISEGELTLYGRDPKHIFEDELRGLIGLVLQDTWLFSGTIRDNIAYGKPNASDEEIIAAAKAAYAHSFIKRLPQGYDTQISEGDNLSAGQKQLLCIARIMLMQPSILILDEATSNIDTRTEVKIQRAFDKIMAGKTSFVVAHRLSTIKEADCILVMKDGRVIEKGNHETLLNQHGFYASLYASQFVQS